MPSNSFISESSIDLLVVGSGAAGLSTCLYADSSIDIILTSKGTIDSSNSWMAQGGLASVFTANDSLENHLSDTINASAGLCNTEVARTILASAPSRIADLWSWGVSFEGTSAEPSLTREGGHSHRRIFYKGDYTGRAVIEKMWQQLALRSNVKVIDNLILVDLLTLESQPVTCCGAVFFNPSLQKFHIIYAKQTVVATGGAGKVFQYTSNWDGATGDGIAACARAGAKLADMEFYQFHPTCLYHKNDRSFLLTEALRGEGGLLVDHANHRFAFDSDQRGELAPRDIVAQSIHRSLASSGQNHVWLDVRHFGRKHLESRFPTVFAKCLQLGIDVSTDLIPVIPAAHYLCGGVVAKVNGDTGIEGLSCIGEAACTGLHGANRLASNSLIECLVGGYECAKQLQLDSKQNVKVGSQILEKYETNKKTERIAESLNLNRHWDEIRQLMWNSVGIVRSESSLKIAQGRLFEIQAEVEAIMTSPLWSKELFELRSLTDVAISIATSALARKESVGTHYREDSSRI